MTPRVDAVVVGAGIVGLAVGRALALAGKEVVVLERNGRVGEGVSSRNSEVIHAGIYYPRASLKTELCVRGRALLYEYCGDKGIAHRRCGKLVVAVDAGQLEALEHVYRQALDNGVGDVELLTSTDVHRREPAIECVAALRSPSTGIIDSHGFLQALQGDLEAGGGNVALRSSFARGILMTDGFQLTITSDGDDTTLESAVLVNAAALEASEVAAAIEGLDAARVPTTRYAKGNYFLLSGKHPFSELIYPLPEPGGLGVHLTLDLAGHVRFGPDVEWVERISYDVDPRRADAFYTAIRRYWPDLPAGSLAPGYAGIRPKLVGPGEPAADFMISGPDDHGIPGLVNLFGIESPGLTAALAIGEKVAELLRSSAAG